MADSRKSLASPAIVILLVAFLITALLIYSYRFLPQRELVIVPGNDTVSHYVDKLGSTKFVWLDKKKRKFLCSYSDGSKFCGLDVLQGDGLTNGVDLSMFEKIEVKINYTGPSKVMRFYIRNYSVDASLPKGTKGASKYINTLVPVSELLNPLSISFNELAIPEWWVVSSGIPREQSFVEFTNVTHLGIDIAYPAPHGDHELELVSVRLVGIYMSKDQWYLMIIGIWALILLLIALRRDIELRRVAQISNENLAIEKVKTNRLKKVSDKYKELAILDTLTGVFNRRGIYQFYENCFDGNPSVDGTMIMLDIDHFKLINDNYGHDIGDKVIRTIGKILLNSVRDQDSVGRWGGEEFIILCVNTDMDGAIYLAEKIRAEVEAHSFEDLPNVTITVSLGIGIINPNKKFEENIKRTDSALYQAKEAGRNCWVDTDTQIHLSTDRH